VLIGSVAQVNQRERIGGMVVVVIGDRCDEMKARGLVGRMKERNTSEHGER
jgi:hypothetical protein